MKKYLLLITLMVSFNLIGQDIVMQNGTFSQCSAGFFYDSGGEFGNAGNSENLTLTLCPDSPGFQAQLNFISFALQANADFLTIYNGPDATYDEIGTFTAVTSPGLITASLTEINPGGQANPDGCLTMVFTSDASGPSSGWVAEISCFEPCQNIDAVLVNTTPAANAEDIIRVCQGEEVTFEGNGVFASDPTGATFEWDFGDGTTGTGQTASKTYNDEGIYIVNLTVGDDNPAGCTSFNLINQFVHVSTNPDFTGSQAAETEICYGESVDITGQVQGVNYAIDCANGGIQANLESQAGLTYNSELELNCFLGQTITDVTQLESICLVIEHTWIGDLEIIIISPSGQQVTLHNQTGGGNFLGNPIVSDGTGPGEGWEYCFSMSGTNLLSNSPTIPGGTPTPGNSIDPASGPFLPVGDFSDFIGSTINGTWTLFIEDHLNIDDGTIFTWSLNFDESLLESDFAFTPIIESEGWEPDPTIVATNGNVITVTPPDAGSYTYTYTGVDDFGCTYSEDVTIEVLPELITEAPNNLVICNPGAPPFIFDLETNTPIVTASAPNATDLVVTYHNSQADAEADTGAIVSPDTYSGADGEEIYVRVEYLNSGCFEVLPLFTLNLSNQPDINPVPDLELCDDPSNDGFEDFVLNGQTAGILGAQDPTIYEVTYHLSFADADADIGALPLNYTNTVNPQPIFVRIETVGDATCYRASPNSVFDLIVNLRDDASFVLTPTCDGATALVSGLAGGTFTFNPVPTDGATINPTTGEVTNAVSGVSYTVEYTTTGLCSTTNTQSFSVLPLDDSSFTISATCDGGTMNVTGATGGTFSFNPVPTDTAVIDPNTGEVTNATPGNSYTIEYLTSGTCPTLSTNILTVFELDNPSFTMTASCDGGLATITGDTGGTFAFNPIPTDGAVIDPNTGAVSNGISGSTYTIEYTTVGNCPQSSTVDVTVIDEDDATFTVSATCDGGIPVINGTTGGTFTFDVAPIDGAVIDPNTGEVTNGTPGTTYSISYTTLGVCSASETVSFDALSVDDASFNISPTCDGGIATITGVLGGIFSFNPVPMDTAAIDPNTGEVTNGTPGETYTIEYTTNGICPNSSLVQLIVNPIPIVIAPSPLEVCDDATPDGITLIDLSLKNTEITGNNPNYSVSYYLNMADADSDMNELAIPYTNIGNPQTVFVRVEDTSTGCYDTTALELVVEQAPVAFTPEPLRYCDPDNDGFGVFTLTDADNEITGGVAGLSVTYHETFANADNGVVAIDTSVDYTNITVDTQILYARVESPTIATNCAAIVELELIVEPTPQLVEPTALEECDDISADGFAQFDLTSKEAEILNGQDPTQYIVSYYETPENAELPDNAIATPTAYTNTDDFNQTIWVRVDDITTDAGCYKLTTLELVVNPLPVLVTPAPLERCDVNNPGDEQEAFMLEEANDEILNGQSGITLTYYETQLDADTATSPIASPYTNTSNAQTIYVRAENNLTGCYNTVEMTLVVVPVPSPQADPLPIEICDENNDGFGEFDLEIRTLEIANGEPDVVITYHETEADAETGDNAISGLYTNTVVNNQLIYVRAENTLTGCYSLTANTLELVVQPSPEIPIDIDLYVLCDDNNDGITQFDLTTKATEIYNGLNPGDVLLTYHISMIDAQTGANPIVNAGNYTNISNPQAIYVRLFNPTTNCEDNGEFELQVQLPPEAIQATPLEECDDLGEFPGDEITTFDLTLKDDEITGGNASWSVTYYETDVDAQLGVNAIPDPTEYTNTSVNGLPANPQTLYAVVTDIDTGCVDFTTLTVRVLPNPTPTPSEDIPDLVLCDDVNTGDGQEIFDLTENEVLILNGEAGVAVTYHTTQGDADSGTDPILDPSNYTNAQTPQQPIFVRVTNVATGCYSLVDFGIRVDPLPAVIAVTDFIQCELNTDGVDSFDLGTKDEEVLNGQDPIQFTVSYHESLAEAEGLINALGSPYTNLSNPQEIFVAITNTVTGCSVATQRFDIEVQEAAQANPDMVAILYEQCDDNMEIDGNPSNDSTQFDLATQDAQVLDGQDPANYMVSYFATEADANLNVNPLPPLYENISNPQIIYARVDNDTPDAITGADTSICYAVAALTLQVNPLPAFELEDSYILCVGTNGTEVLTPLELDTGLSSTNYSFEWSYNGTVLPTETGPSIMPTQGGTYSVTVTDNSSSAVTGCTNTDSTEVIESEPPTLVVALVTQVFEENNVIEATASGPGDYEYSLDGGPWQDSGTFGNVSAGEREITARDKNGCGLVTESIFVIDYPLYFTPNGDGNHDTWNIAGIGDTAKIYIFDRYGKLLKQISPTGSGWDGTFNGTNMPTSDYWFTVEYNEPSNNTTKEFKAHFTLKR